MKVINPRSIRAAISCLLLLGAHALHAQTPVPHFIAHDGQLTGANAAFTGLNGKFKFELVDSAAPPLAFWKNDDFAAALAANGQPAAEPANAITLPVDKGTYGVFLGAGGPTPWITYPVFNHAGLRIRTWFSPTGAAGSFVLQPDTLIPAVGYAMQVPDGTITTAKIAANAVTSAQIANGAIGLGKLGTGAVTNANVAAGAINVGNLLTSAAPAAGQSLSFNGTGLSWTVPLSVWSLNGANAYYNSGKVGIGTNTPHTSLQVTNGSFSVTGVNTGIDVIGAGKGVFISNSATEGYIFASDFGNFPATPIPLILQNTSGSVGIGGLPKHRLGIVGGPAWTTNNWLGSIDLPNASAIGWAANAGAQRFGIGHTDTGFCVFRTASDPGAVNSPALYDFFISDAGRIGLNTVTPAANLDVRGSGTTEATVWSVNERAIISLNSTLGGVNRIWTMESGVFGTPGLFAIYDRTAGRARLTIDTAGVVSVGVLKITGGSDLAEPFQMKEETLEKGAVVVIDNEHPGRLKRSRNAYDTRVAGIVSGANGINPGIALHQEGMLEGGQNVALSGRVYVQADASSGPISPGDLLTTSNTPGHAMKATDHAKAQGAVIGKAMSSLDEGTGMVLVLVSLQ